MTGSAMAKNPKRAPHFTVVIPWHRDRENLRRAIASLEQQVHRDFETVIVCNGPGAAEISGLQADPALRGCSFVAIREADANRARNAGIANARGRWIAFLDADDRFLPGKLTAVRAAIERDGADLWISRGLRIRSTGTGTPYPPQLLGEGENISEFLFCRGANCSASAIVVRRAVAASVGFTDGLPKFQDSDFLIRIGAAGHRIAMIADPLYEWTDTAEAGRVSRGRDYERHREWARGLTPPITSKAFHAFVARRIAQHRLTTAFWPSLGEIARGWRRGGVPTVETLLFAARGLLPERLARAALDLKARLDGVRCVQDTATTRRLSAPLGADKSGATGDR